MKYVKYLFIAISANVGSISESLGQTASSVVKKTKETKANTKENNKYCYKFDL